MSRSNNSPATLSQKGYFIDLIGSHTPCYHFSNKLGDFASNHSHSTASHINDYKILTWAHYLPSTLIFQETLVGGSFHSKSLLRNSSEPELVQ